MLEYTSIEDTQLAISEDAHRQKLRSYIIKGWPPQKDDLEHGMTHDWPIRSE